MIEHKALLEEETALRRRAEKRCAELKQKYIDLETDVDGKDAVLADSATVIQEQLVSILF